jgi:hypothetical protein
MKRLSFITACLLAAILTAQAQIGIGMKGLNKTAGK